MGFASIESAMQRRSYLLTLGATGVTATAGCLTGILDSKPKNTVLSEPDEQLADSGDLEYPAHGQEFPALELPDATSETVIDTGELDSVAVVTTFFASCPAECGILLNNLAVVQNETIERGLEDDVLFLPITFDPERDDAEFLRENSERVGADLSAGNWHNLRPEDADEAETIVSDRLGVGFEQIGDSDRTAGYDFVHIVVTWLVNPDGVVERAYRGELLDIDEIVGDVETVVESYESMDDEQ